MFNGKRIRIFVFFVFVISLPVFTQTNERSQGLLEGLPTLKSYISKRISSYDRTGNYRDYLVIKPRETAEIARIRGLES
jgi:hypothetical protein